MINAGITVNSKYLSGSPRNLRNLSDIMSVTINPLKTRDSTQIKWFGTEFIEKNPKYRLELINKGDQRVKDFYWDKSAVEIWKII